MIDLTGQRFARLLVLERTSNNRDGKTRWLCACQCGQRTTVLGKYLRSGHTRSCGCLMRETAAGLQRTHGGTRTKEYRVWQLMRARCDDATNPHYGGRGLSVCDRWEAFENFYADMGPRPSSEHQIERRDNDAGYGPENCVWATPKEQANNRSSNRLLTLGGLTLTMQQWSEELCLPYKTIHSRVGRGWSVERALSTPVK
jgi:hypothetical protein